MPSFLTTALMFFTGNSLLFLMLGSASFTSPVADAPGWSTSHQSGGGGVVVGAGGRGRGRVSAATAAAANATGGPAGVITKRGKRDQIGVTTEYHHKITTNARGNVW
jgi:hypothetical protein